MAEGFNLDKGKKQSQKAIDDTSIYIQDTLLSVSAKIGESLRDAVNEAFDGVDATVLKTVGNDLTRAFKSSAKFSDDVASNQAKIKQGVLSTKDVQKQLDALAVKRSALARKIMLARRVGADINLEDLAASNKALKVQKEQIKNDKKRTQAIEKNMGATGEIFKRLAGNRFFGSILNADEGLKSMREEAAKGTKGFKLMGKGISSAFKNLERGTVILAAIGALIKSIKFVADLMLGANQQATNLARSLGSSVENANLLRQRFMEVRKETGTTRNNVENLAEATDQLVESFGYVKNFSTDTLNTQTLLTKRLQLSGEQAANFLFRVNAIGESAIGTVDTITQLGNEFVNNNGIAIRTQDIFKEISKTSEEISGYFGFNTKELAAGVLQVRKFGLNLEQANSVAKGLLDFESSIGSELEAELLTGKEFNFERARTLAMTGRVSEATEEVLKQMEGLTEEQRRSPIIMESLAKSTNLSVSELNRAYLATKDITAAQNELNRIKEEEGPAAARAFLQKTAILQAEAKEIEERISTSEKFNETLKDVKQQLMGAFSGELLRNLGKSLPVLANILIQFTEKASKVGIFRALFSGGSPDVGVPGVAGAGLSVKVAKSIGQAIFSARSENAVKPRENKPAAIKTTEETKLATGGIVTKPTKATVGEAGAEAVVPLNQFYAKMDEMIAAIKEGGDVFIDGNKAGMALNLGAYRSD